MFKILQFGFEAALIVLILLFVYVQLARPLMRGTPVFPIRRFFRKRPNLERQMEDVTEEVEISAQQRALDREKSKLGHGKKAPNPAGKSN